MAIVAVGNLLTYTYTTLDASEVLQEVLVAFLLNKVVCVIVAEGVNALVAEPLPLRLVHVIPSSMDCCHW